MSPQLPDNMPEGFPVLKEGKCRAKLSAIDDRVITGETEWDGKKACWWRFSILSGENKGLSVSESTIMPFNADDTPVEANVLSKCWRWRDICKIVYGGEFPKGMDWAEFKQKVTGTEWAIEVANRKFRGVERSEVASIEKPSEEAPF